ncbi:hypothetical protein SAMN05892883_2939 [Jatrophihabitans sp. GAS493]|uniref:hypothetical protein n=1 Tax=Jatrophihabitans sp. GAS493 TaxID=1907575 RepID=UPI000BB7880F|nr:hypothetical protein [Jatrophihabitans sp. GAS493]SOD73678.1 hypothetical protein SAMN05892883_2939 [Jatrophihabitans sp. GAS493]
MLCDLQQQRFTEIPDQEPGWRPWSWWGTFGWLWLVGPAAVALVAVYVGGARTGDGTRGVSYDFGVASGLIWLFIAVALSGRALLRRLYTAGRTQRRLGADVWRARGWPRPWATLWEFRIELLAELCLVFFLAAGWSALGDQRLRDSSQAQQILATVTHADKHCDRFQCSYDSYGDYYLNGRQQSDVLVVESADKPVRGLVPVFVDPAHPRHAVYVHDHSKHGLVLGGIAAVLLLIGNPIYFRTNRSRLRQRWRKVNVTG